MKIDISTLSPDLAGEVLREYVFGNPEEKWAFSFKQNFMPIDRFQLPAQAQELLQDGLNVAARTDCQGLFVFLQFDGDTILGFILDNILYYNTDAKKSYGWKKE